MTEAVLSTDAAFTYSDFMWWWMQRSTDESRLAAMLGSYWDESAVDGGSPVSVVGGILLNHKGYSSLELEWSRVIARYPSLGQRYVHMKDFGQNEKLSAYPLDEKRRLLGELVRVINDCKAASIGSTLSPSQYKSSFASFLSGDDEKLSIHGMCFLQAMVIQGGIAHNHNYQHEIPFMLDEGCPDRSDIDEAHKFIRTKFQPSSPSCPTYAGGLTWEDDKKFPQLQAADLIAWSVRRRSAGFKFSGGTEPLADIFDSAHIERNFEQAWIDEIATNLRRELKR